MPDNQGSWSPEEAVLAIRTLEKIQLYHMSGTQIPAEVYEAFCRSKLNVSSELAAFDADGRLYLVQRPSATESPAEPFPGQWHLPGVTRLAGESYPDSIRRLLASEGVHFNPDDLIYAGHYEIDDQSSHRGDYLARLDVVFNASLPLDSKGRFFKHQEIPWGELVEYHGRILIPAALKAMTK